MSIVSIQVQSLKDVAKGKPIFDGINSLNDFISGEITSFGILEGGTVSGLSSVAFKIKVGDGDKPIICEMTANTFKMLSSALDGAEKRFTDEK